MLKAVIFDLDGVLIDSTPLQLSANQQFVESFGKMYLPPKSGREGMRIVDIVMNIKDIYNLPGKVEDLYEKRQQIYFDIARKHLQLFPSVVELLKKLKQRKLTLAIATSGSRDYLQLILQKFPELENYFSYFVTGDDVVRGKPYPDIYQKTLEKLKMQAYETVVIEDSVNGILAAKAAKISVICVPNKHWPDADYAQADMIFSDLSEVAQAIY